MRSSLLAAVAGSSSAKSKWPAQLAASGAARNASTAFSQPGSSRQSACRNKSQSPDAAAAPAASWLPRPCGATTTRALADLAQSTVSSDEPPSATITSPIDAELRSSASVSGNVSPAFNVGMTAEIRNLFLYCSGRRGIILSMDMPVALRQRKGRGAASNDSGRFEAERRMAFDDGWGTTDQEPAPLTTTLSVDSTRTIIARNDSPDIGFDRSINPYRGCEHGCIYCYARPSHAFLGLSPGLDSESRLFYKPQAAKLLAAELSKKGYVCRPIALGSNTDPYQPVERKLGVTRSILEVLRDFRHPVTIVTKS